LPALGGPISPRAARSHPGALAGQRRIGIVRERMRRLQRVVVIHSGFWGEIVAGRSIVPQHLEGVFSGGILQC